MSSLNTEQEHHCPSFEPAMCQSLNSSSHSLIIHFVISMLHRSTPLISFVTGGVVIRNANKDTLTP